MADDAIFNTSSPDDGQANGSNDQPSSEQAPTTEELTRRLAIGIAQAQAPLQQELAAMRQELGAMRQSAAQPPSQPAAAGNDEGDMVSRFISNPHGTLRSEIGDVVNPVLNPMMDAVQEPIIDKERSRVTARYGEKYWTEVVEPRFRNSQSQLRQQNPAAAVNPQAIRYIISSIVGSEDLADVTEQHRQQTAKTAADAAKRQPRPPSFIGGAGRTAFPGDSDEPLSQADVEFLATLGRKGYKFSEADYRAARLKPRDMEERFQQEIAAQRKSGAR